MRKQGSSERQQLLCYHHLPRRYKDLWPNRNRCCEWVWTRGYFPHSFTKRFIARFNNETLKLGSNDHSTHGEKESLISPYFSLAVTFYEDAQFRNMARVFCPPGSGWRNKYYKIWYQIMCKALIFFTVTLRMYLQAATLLTFFKGIVNVTLSIWMCFRSNAILPLVFA